MIMSLLFGLVAAFIFYFMVSSRAVNFSTKIPNSIRWIMIPFYAMLGGTLASTAASSFMTLSAIIVPILSPHASGATVYWFTGNIILPFVQTYGLICCAYIMAPKFKIKTTYIICTIFILFILYSLFGQDFIFGQHPIAATAGYGDNLFSTIITCFSYLIGMYCGVNLPIDGARTRE